MKVYNVSPGFLSKLCKWVYSRLACKLRVAKMNYQMNGFINNSSSVYDEDCFLFSSESVGEGHPGKL